MPSSSRAPCTVPSSPKRPCNAMKQRLKPLRLSSERSRSAGSKACASTPLNCSALSTPLPDISETSRSAERPPMRTATFPKLLSLMGNSRKRTPVRRGRKNYTKDFLLRPLRNLCVLCVQKTARVPTFQRGSYNTSHFHQLRRHATDRAGTHAHHDVTVVRDLHHRRGHGGDVVHEDRFHLARHAHRARQRTAVGGDDRRLAGRIHLSQQHGVGLAEHLDEILEAVARACIAMGLERKHQAPAGEGAA